MSNVLNYMAYKHHHFIHGGGRKATHFLIDIMKLSGKEKVLEIGVGTGSTAVVLKSRYPDLEYSGIDTNEEMLNIAYQRIQFSKVGTVQFYQISGKDKYPFSEEYFDAILIESVLGILSDEDTGLLINEVHRVLRKGGDLLLNESIWNQEVSHSLAQEVNKEVEAYYGIQQAHETLLHKGDYIKYLNCIMLIQKI